MRQIEIAKDGEKILGVKCSKSVNMIDMDAFTTFGTYKITFSKDVSVHDGDLVTIDDVKYVCLDAKEGTFKMVIGG